MSTGTDTTAPRPQRRLTLAASIVGAGASAKAWNWPGTKWNRFADFEHYRRSAEIARSGNLDAIFVSDHPALQRDARHGPGHLFDPIVLFSAIAGAVPDIGFVLTASTSYNSPYNLARRLASLDTISGGRVIFNAVANFNPDIAANFTADGLLDREDRYRKADEFLDVVKKLWLSWDAPQGPEPQRPLWDETTARVIDHHGEFFDVRGPLNVPVGPQGHPVISQAGASEQGIDFAGRHAEIVYAALLEKQSAVDFAAKLDAAAQRHGRPADSIRLFPGVNVYLGDTHAEALRRHEVFSGADSEDDLIAHFLHQQRTLNPAFPKQLDADKPLKPEWFEPQEDQTRPIGFSKALQDLVRVEEPTTRQIIRRVGGAGGHRLVIGTPKEVADALIDWWADGAVSGYNAHFPLLHDDLERFVAQVVPILQTEGVFPTGYDAPTIRGRFGLPEPGISPAEEAA
ncbi:Nitrilotriacetate monooxygenase component A [Nocardia cerradoensis]|uniref:Nitrilotriacetate monooxygenase component A n=1 Tax=Nocardia cerradoensis TaxID=85688 RepID=A0A231HDN3_9NOCA|nr:NtaA/DmoA family FMN-dependent monooxygenase [Nocardia cerradoensis]OXR46906.1 Nitrilotriacetate monooxygenase component A [Nocardia cerradoensis]